MAIVTMIINIVTGLQTSLNYQNPDRAIRVMIVHMVSGLLYILGGLGTIGFGIAWIVQAISK